MNEKNLFIEIERLRSNYKKYTWYNDFFGKKAELNHMKIQRLINRIKKDRGVTLDETNN